MTLACAPSCVLALEGLKPKEIKKESPCMEADKQAIHEALQKQRHDRTKRVKSHLP